jgi:hypothetical protein
VCLVHDSREFRRNEGSSITIGKTDDSNILWYSEPFFLDSIEGGIGDEKIYKKVVPMILKIRESSEKNDVK